MVSKVDFCLGVWTTNTKVEKFVQIIWELLNSIVCGVLIFVV